MAPRPTAERPPSGLDSFWSNTWDYALRVMKDQGTWRWEQKPLLDEYIAALREAKDAREAAEASPYIATDQGLLHGHPGWQQADRASKRGRDLAELLVLTPKAQKALVERLDDAGDDDQTGL